MDTEEPVRPCYEWQKGDVNVRNSANYLQEELSNVGPNFVQKNQQMCRPNLR
jgi:hypothetical protein